MVMILHGMSAKIERRLLEKNGLIVFKGYDLNK
jgi:hypothetical protein